MRVTHKLECTIDSAEIQNAKDALARLTPEYERKTREEKERASGVRNGLKALWEEIVDLATRANKGVAFKEVRCEERIDRDRGMRIVVRLDTGKEVPELCKPYNVEKEEPLTAKADAKAKQNGAAKTKASATSEFPDLKVDSKGLVEVLDIKGTVRKVRRDIAESLLRKNREGLPCIHGFDDDPNVELAMVVGVPVYGTTDKGTSVALTAPQVKLVRDGYRCGSGGISIASGDDYVEIVGFKGMAPMPSKAPERGGKKSAKRAAAAPKKGGRGRKGAEARA